MDLSDEDRAYLEGLAKRQHELRQREVLAANKEPEVADCKEALDPEKLPKQDHVVYYVDWDQVYQVFGSMFIDHDKASVNREYALAKYREIYDYFEEYSNVKNTFIVLSRRLKFGWNIGEHELTETKPEFSDVEMD